MPAEGDETAAPTTTETAAPTNEEAPTRYVMNLEASRLNSKSIAVRSHLSDCGHSVVRQTLSDGRGDDCFVAAFSLAAAGTAAAYHAS